VTIDFLLFSNHPPDRAAKQNHPFCCCQEPEAPAIERRERVDCVCGAVSEADYAGLWLQCDACAAWQHAACLGLSRAPAGGALQRCA
jgi:PHD-finger